MSEKENYYDAEIAPVLAELAQKCSDNKISFVAIAEYGPGETGRTQQLQPDAGLEMVMAAHCIKMGVNIDGYIIGISRYADENGIDTGGSFVLSGLKNID